MITFSRSDQQKGLAELVEGSLVSLDVTFRDCDLEPALKRATLRAIVRQAYILGDVRS